MAIVDDLCNQLTSGENLACTTLTKGYWQQFVVIPKAYIDDYDIVTTDFSVENPVCKYHATMSLKEGRSGLRFTGPENGISFKGYFDKSNSDQGQVQYSHKIDLLITNMSEEAKCRLFALDQISVVVAAQQLGQSNRIELFGLEYGLTTADYTGDPSTSGGVVLITLQSREAFLESKLPVIYKSGVEGGEVADFDANFANPITP